ncbi:unnamed protein product [Mytilus edulis]|uniref:SGNH hydrolase-type esterase domain-containing protein n=1 Tax=Mytilus edulis TaxID=6550 RepID=A0A8S3UMN1_MYTED|nr:unnamed protein product [Mytilus edulis]
MPSPKALHNTRLKTGTMPFQYTPGSNQGSFSLTNDSIFLWRRALIVRYITINGTDPSSRIVWNDYDRRSQILQISDEKNKFTNKQPHKDLFKSTVSVSVGKQKQFVVTLFYTTKTGMVQGQASNTWLQSEFKSISEVINTIIELQKKENNNYDVDKLFGEIQSNMCILNQIPKRDETKRDESEETQVNKNNNNSQSDQLVTSNKPHENINNKNMKQGEELLLSNHEHDDQSMICQLQKQKADISNLTKTIHDLEKELVEKDVKLDLFISACQELKSRVDKMEKEKIDEDKMCMQMNIIKEKIKHEINEQIQVKSTQLEQQNRQLALDVRQENNINNAKNIEKLNGIEIEMKEMWVKSKEKSENSTSDKNITETQQLIADQADHVATCTRNSNNKPLTNIGSKTNDENNNINKNTKNSNTASNSSSTEEIKNEMKDITDVWIIGSSIIKDLDAKRMYQYKRVKVTTLHDKTVYGATKFIASGKVKAKNIVFQIGSNDIEERQADQVIMEIENLIQQTKECVPEATITFGECLPRIYRDKVHTKEFNERGHILNLELSELCKETNCHFIKYDYISPDHFRDGIHLKGYGIAILVSCMKRVINPLIGVKSGDRRDQNTHASDYRKVTNYGQKGVQYMQKNYQSNTGNYMKKDQFNNYYGQNQNMFSQSNHSNNYRKDQVEGNGNRDRMLEMMEYMLQEMRNMR